MIRAKTVKTAATLAAFAALLCLNAAAATAAPQLEVGLSSDTKEIQKVTVKATGGQWKLRFGTGGLGVAESFDMDFDASAAEVQAQLNSISNISAGGGSVTVSGGPGNEGGTNPYIVTFDGGPLKSTDVPELIASSASPPLSGAGAGVSVQTTKQGGVRRGDERVDYTATVRNAAPAGVPVVVGDLLTCGGTWFTEGSTNTLVYRWLRNGEPIPGATTNAYTIAAADEGKVIECQVTATNTVSDVSDPADFVGRTRVSTGIVVEPPPATAPPLPPGLVLERPVTSGPLDGSADRELTCNAEIWGGSPTSYTYRWFRNGVEIAGSMVTSAATSSKLTVVAAEQTPPAGFQCMVTATNAGGSVTMESNPRRTTPEPNPNTPDGDPRILTANYTKGPVTLEIELPGGQETVAYRIDPSPGWSCASQPAAGEEHAKVICTRSGNPSVLAPQDSYTPVSFRIRPGADAPDLALAKATVTGGGAPAPAIAEDAFTFEPAVPFDIESFEIKVAADAAETTDYTRAGGHPVAAGAEFFFTRHRVGGTQQGETADYGPLEHLKSTFVDAARGFVGNALTVKEPCASVEAVAASTCPAESAVGGIVLHLAGLSFLTAIYSVEPEYGTPAQFAFAAVGGIYTFVPRLRPDEGYAISFEAAPAPEGSLIQGAAPTICGFGLKLSAAGGSPEGCLEPDDPEANPVPLITNPTRCSGPPPAQVLRVNSWEHPADFKTRQFSTPAITECENVDFEPEVELTPTNTQADSPTGLDVEFSMPTEGLFEPEGVAQATMDNAVVTFPEGMTVNPSSANGLGACSLAQIKFHSNAAEECPESSRIGTVEIETPLIRETLHGSVYLAKQNDNPFNSAFGLYMSFSSDRDGVRVKVAGKLVPDPVTGQLVSTFAENPEWPFSRLELHFNSGPRAPLVNPPSCGTYAIHSELSPWSAVNPANPTADEIVAHDDTYEVTEGPNGGPCPENTLDPKLKAGVANPTAGTKTPFVFSLSREDGTQRFAAVDVANPKGLTAYLKGIPYCPESALASISGAEETGRTEYASPSCPAQSQVGTVSAGSGAGPFPFYVDTGRVYLAGPYKGAPVSLAAVTPAVAGPYDLGSVLVRVPLYVNPVTSQVVAKSDPIPTALHGIVLDVRDIRLALDRPGFTAAPTSCEPGSVEATVTGQQGAVAKVANRFQVGGCDALGFKPQLNMRLFGGTKRGAHPKFRAILTPRPGDANIASASVALPHSEFLDQAHIRTVCTRVQFAAKACPPGSIYGFAEATTPLLDQPVSGPAYLRSSDNQLPDLVMALRGPDSQPIEVHVVGRIDSVNGGIRSTFDVVPDQPVTQFTLTMQGGKKGLLVNSRDICKGKADKATAKFTGHNGKQLTLRPELKNACKGQARKGKGQKKKHKR